MKGLNVFIWIIFFVFSGMIYSNPLLTDSLVVYFPFNGNAHDQSVNGFHGSVDGATLVKGYNGIDSTAYNFDGIDDHIVIGNVDKLKIEGDLTISFWMNANSFHGKMGIIVCQADNTDLPNTNVLYKLNFNNTNFLHYWHENDLGVDFIHIFSEYSFNEDQWYHISLTRDKSIKTINLFVNAERYGTGLYQFDPDNGSFSTFGIGEDHGSVKDDRFFDGILDEVQVYNRVLSLEEIVSLASKPPIANFVADINYGNTPLNVQFTDLSKSSDSTSSLDSWEWDFDNNGIVDSGDRSPQWTYENSGIYSVKLRVCQSATCGVMLKTDYIVVISERSIITSIRDIPYDQGGWVEVNFARSVYDTNSLQKNNNSVELYTIEIEDGGRWRAATSLTAYGKNEYSALVHTTKDSTFFDNGIINFRVIAGMEEGNYVSEVVSGYSIDNLMPEIPQRICLVLGESNSTLLKWEPSPDDDFQYFLIYRNQVNQFDPVSEFYAQTIDNEFIDYTVAPGKTYYYAVKAVDFSGNYSEFSDVVTTNLTDIYGNNEDRIGSYFLNQNYPNPFNPVTTIGYGLPEESWVKVTIYDLIGREIISLVDQNQRPGKYEVRWNGIDQTENSVPSGIYLYKIESKNFQKVNRMILLH